MFRNHPAAIAVLTALALLATTLPSSVTTAGELKGQRKKQGAMLVPAVQAIREAGRRSQKRGAPKVKVRSATGKPSQTKGAGPHVKVFDGRAGQ